MEVVGTNRSDRSYGLGYTQDENIYNAATRIGTPQSVGTPIPGPRDTDSDGRTITKKYIRQVEVPYTREVKVPVRTHKLVPATTVQRIPTKKLVEVPSFKYVDQEYTDIEDREMTREKVVWVKKVVPEKYVGKVEVRKTRKVKVPTTLVKEVQEFVDVQVPTTKLVEETGWRVDRVQDRKLMEVEEHRKYRLVPEPTGEVHVAGTRDLGRTKGRHLSRQVGDVYGREEDCASVSCDSQSDRGSYIADRLAEASIEDKVPAGGYGSLIGVLMYNAEPKGTGCRVSRVHYNQPGWHAGLREGDIITAINGEGTGTLTDFRNAILRSGLLLRITLRRQANYMVRLHARTAPVPCARLYKLALQSVSLTRKRLPN
jgi:hypothetical protein